MTETVKRTGAIRLFSLALCVALGIAWGLPLPARAYTVPDRPENQVVLDGAGVLSAETEDAIIEENRRLFPETGAQVAVVTVDFLDGAAIEDYAYTLFNSWGIGSQERNNGVLLLLAIGEDNYYAMAGYGIDSYFDGAKLKELLNAYLEPDFAAREYDAGVEKFFNAVVSDLRTYYQENPPQEDPYPVFDYEEEKPTPWERFWATVGPAMAHVARVVIVAAVLLFVFLLLHNLGKGGGPRSGGGGGGGFWSGWFLGNMMGRSAHRHYGWRPPRPPRGGFGGGFGGFHGGGGGGFGAGRGGGGGFHGGGGTHGGGVGRG